MILKGTGPVRVHNPKNINTKHGGIVLSEHETMSTTLFLSSACVWRTLTLYHMGLINLFKSELTSDSFI